MAARRKAEKRGAVEIWLRLCDSGCTIATSQALFVIGGYFTPTPSFARCNVALSACFVRSPRGTHLSLSFKLWEKTTLSLRPFLLFHSELPFSERQFATSFHA